MFGNITIVELQHFEKWKRRGPNNPEDPSHARHERLSLFACLFCFLHPQLIIPLIMTCLEMWLKCGLHY